VNPVVTKCNFSHVNFYICGYLATCHPKWLNEILFSKKIGNYSHVTKILVLFFSKKKKRKKKQNRNLCSVFLFSSPNPAYIQAGLFSSPNPAYIQARTGNHPVAGFEPIKPKIQKPKMGKKKNQ
jgi:hypothetical protein